MKIVYIEDCFDPTASYQINEILKQPHGRFEKILITSTDLTPFHKKLISEDDHYFAKKYNVKIIRLPVLFKISSRRWIKGLYKTIKKESADIVYMHGILDFKDIINLFICSKKIIFRDCHMSWSGVSYKNANWFYKIAKYLLFFPLQKMKKYEKIYSLGLEECEYLEKIGISKKNIELFEHGYNKNEYFYLKKERENFRKNLKIETDDILISYIGKMDDLKKPHIILKMIEKIDRFYLKDKKIMFLFLGPQDQGYMKNKFNPLLLKLNINNIKILGGKKASELREVYSGSDICFWPKQTTLSSIHAQVCQTTVMMENELSNKERVVDNNNLYEINNISEAIIKLKNIVEKKLYKKEKNKWYLEKIEHREYSKRMIKLIDEWEKLVEDKNENNVNIWN